MDFFETSKQIVCNNPNTNRIKDLIFNLKCGEEMVLYKNHVPLLSYLKPKLFNQKNDVVYLFDGWNEEYSPYIKDKNVLFTVSIIKLENLFVVSNVDVHTDFFINKTIFINGNSKPNLNEIQLFPFQPIDSFMVYGLSTNIKDARIIQDSSDLKNIYKITSSNSITWSDCVQVN